MRTPRTHRRPNPARYAPPAAMAQVATPSKSDCQRVGCLDHCACQPQDKWIWAVGGFLVGGTLVGGTLYAMGRR